ncbi:MAG: O-antigen ligase family protein [Patescibacteria group bacterium]|nr:O-antigen ligase family protein [Patescibacteria group bacterium]
MKKPGHWLSWFDKNLIKILLSIFIFLIPLYPKLPFKMVNFTYIAIRLEDFFVFFLTFIFFLQILRKKTDLNWHYFLLFLIYWFFVFLSTFWGIYIIKTIDVKHLGILHSLRRVEYMIVFFIALSETKTQKDFFYFFSLVFSALSLVIIYGIGQKFFGWPAVQTMNPEYAKGYLLFLTPEARVSSTFAGHYDLAAYLVFLIPITLGFFFSQKKIGYFFIFVLSLFVLVLTASRVSFLAYLVSVFIFLTLFRKWRYFLIIFFLTVIFTFSSKNLTSRLSRTFQVKQLFVNEKTGQVIVPQKITSKELPAGSFYLTLKDNQTLVDQKEEEIVKEKILNEIREKNIKKGKKLSPHEEKKLVNKQLNSLKPVKTVVSDISFATRLQIEWPRAIQAFLKNPLLGTGPSSITEATDNDYLRWLGEFGLLGTISFLIILFTLIKNIYQKTSKLKNDKKILFFGYLFGIFGLLINASYIDVFEASKLAYNFWLISGLFISGINYGKNKI